MTSRNGPQACVLLAIYEYGVPSKKLITSRASSGVVSSDKALPLL